MTVKFPKQHGIVFCHFVEFAWDSEQEIHSFSNAGYDRKTHRINELNIFRIRQECSGMVVELHKLRLGNAVVLCGSGCPEPWM
jgi:hypothetical protein